MGTKQNKNATCAIWAQYRKHFVHKFNMKLFENLWCNILDLAIICIYADKKNYYNSVKCAK